MVKSFIVTLILCSSLISLGYLFVAYPQFAWPCLIFAFVLCAVYNVMKETG